MLSGKNFYADAKSCANQLKPAKMFRSEIMKTREKQLSCAGQCCRCRKALTGKDRRLNPTFAQKSVIFAGQTPKEHFLDKARAFLIQNPFTILR
jgi:hypothetical protein